MTRFALIILSVLALSGCFKDCDTTICNSGQIATLAAGINGKCQCLCDVYHEGTDCSVWKGSKFLGTYTGYIIVNDTQISPKFVVVTNLLGDSSLPEVGVNFLLLWADTASLCARITNADALQTIPTTGVGYLSPDLDRLTLNYKVGWPPSGTYNYYTFTGVRQH